ncbi:hypothetical protein D9615_008694 [Tricholomella constricta]|uniref:Chromatin elongation factor SPT5 n=1 Tax=Tricholomella constricta TaxID=117010 RepID=A0A8H5M2G4_9AGAR|nr:hypothetical protein D9615_008694 [Tricholomella constricta]
MEAQDARMFLSLEATVDDVSEDDDDGDEDDGFIQDDDEDDGDEPIPLDRTRSHHLLLLENTRAQEDGWDSLLDRARARGRSNDVHYSPPHDLPFVVGSPHLWRVAVKPGCEESVAFVLMTKIMFGDVSRWPIQSIIGRASRPGWIVVEATKASSVQELCLGVANVFCKQVHVVDPEDGPSWLKESVSYSPSSPSWLRLTKYPYRGDLAFVQDSGTWGTDVIVVPRIDFQRRKSNPGKRRRTSSLPRIGGTTRPQQALFDVDKIKEIWGHESVETRNQAFLFRGKLFLDGYLCLQTDDFHPDAAIPSLDEIALFRHWKSIPKEFLAHTLEIMAARRLCSGDPVRVVTGQAQGASGIVESIIDEEAVVRLSSDNMQLTLPVDSLRKKVTIGDEVIIATGPHVGVHGWVISNVRDTLVVYSHQTAQEVGSLSRVSSIVDRITRYKFSAGIPIPTLDDKFGSSVTATMRRERFQQSNLVLLDDPDLTPLGSTQTNSSTKPKPSSSFLGSGARMNIGPSALPLTPSTPLPPASSVSFSPAWNPSSRTPNSLSAFPYNPWMESPFLAGKRIKVQFKDTKAVLRDPGWSHGDYEGKSGLWVGTEASLAKIVLGVHSTLLVPERYVRPLVPSVKGQNVIVLDGDASGAMEYCVVSVGATDCVTHLVELLKLKAASEEAEKQHIAEVVQLRESLEELRTKFDCEAAARSSENRLTQAHEALSASILSSLQAKKTYQSELEGKDALVEDLQGVIDGLEARNQDLSERPRTAEHTSSDRQRFLQFALMPHLPGACHESGCPSTCMNRPLQLCTCTSHGCKNNTTSDGRAGFLVNQRTLAAHTKLDKQTAAIGHIKARDAGAKLHHDATLAAAVDRISASTDAANIPGAVGTPTHRGRFAIERSRKMVQHASDALEAIESLSKQAETVGMSTATAQDQHILENLQALGGLQQLLDTESLNLSTISKVTVPAVSAVYQQAYERLKSTKAYIISSQDTWQQEAQRRVVERKHGTSVYDTKEHFRPIFENTLPVVQLVFLMITACHLILRLPRRGTRWLFIMCHQVIMCTLCMVKAILPIRITATLDKFPRDIRAVIDGFHLDRKYTVYASCPRCHHIHAPTIINSIPLYPERCQSRRYGNSCKELLVRPQTTGKARIRIKVPIRQYIVFHFNDWLGGLLSRSGYEEKMDSAWDKLALPADGRLTDLFHGSMAQSFKGPDGKHFSRSGSLHAGRYLFALSFDFFSPDGVKVGKKQKSVGLITLTCLNIPITE